jgi:hypothetical protein
MLKKFISTLLLVPLFCLFLLVGGSYALDGKAKTPKPTKPAPNATYVISQATPQKSQSFKQKRQERKSERQQKKEQRKAHRQSNRKK